MRLIKASIGFGLVMMLLVACSQEQQMTVSPTEVVVAVSPQAATEVVAAVSPQAPTEAVLLPTSVLAEAEVDSCVGCHTDKDTLIKTAKAEEKEPEESKGDC